MVDVSHSYGENAGKVWKLLQLKEHLTEKELKEKTGLHNNDFFCAIGWLAKENKICKDKSTYKLGETNLTSKIGKDAGMVWKILDMWGEVDLLSISRLAHINEEDIFYAVGWLAREGKMGGTKTGNKNNDVSFWLK